MKNKGFTQHLFPIKRRRDSDIIVNLSQKKKGAGFTLIELLVVIAIIGLLASVVLVSLNSARQKSRDAKRVSDMNQMAKAMELYFDSNQSYPVLAGWTNLDSVVGMTPTYLSRLPTAPNPADTATCSAAGNCTGKTANDYCYKGSTTFYTISFCLGANVGGTSGGISAGARVLTPGGFR